MTTEVLRNMIYAGSRTLANLGFVVMDEVHYLADRFRGAVWEEVIIGLADSVQVVALSATVSNAEEFGDWLDEVRGEVAVVVSERRPVPLFQHVMVGRRLLDLFATGADATATGRRGVDVNPELAPTGQGGVAQPARRLPTPPRSPGTGEVRPDGSGRYGGAAARERHASSRHLVPRRDATVERLEAEGPAAGHLLHLLAGPGCDAAVRQLMQLGAAAHDRGRAGRELGAHRRPPHRRA